MAEQQIRFDDGAAYERMMGTCSRLAGNIFLDWLAPRPGLSMDRHRLRQRRLHRAAGNAARRPRFRGSIRPRRSLPLPAHVPRRAWRNSARATPRHCPSPTAGSMAPLWRW